MGLAAKLSDTPDFAERQRLSGERGARCNCLNCGGILHLPTDVQNGYGGDQSDCQFDCPRCRSVYSVDAANAWTVSFELAVVQNEHRGKRVAPPKRARNDAYRDPVYGPIRRAHDRLEAAERSLDRYVYLAHTEHGQSYRTIAAGSGESKTTIERRIQRERERVGNKALRRSDHAPAFSVIENDDFEF